ncbi:MAG: maltose O-acetyltransferase [Propionivibrio sp.]|nr:maltose O-acetyltransferase [Propionivibrio sp.]
MSKTATLIGSNLRLKILTFGAYSFVENLLLMSLELLPHPVRYWIFKALLKHLGANSMVDYETYFRYPWKISIGNNVSINRGCEFFGSMVAGGAHISIGNHCTLAPHVRVLSATHDYRRLDLPDQAKSVSIGNYVWIGAGATILPGITIGDGAVIAACSVVTHDVTPFSIVAGNPARFIRRREVDNEHPLQ